MRRALPPLPYDLMLMPLSAYILIPFT